MPIAETRSPVRPRARVGTPPLSAAWRSREVAAAPATVEAAFRKSRRAMRLDSILTSRSEAFFARAGADIDLDEDRGREGDFSLRTDATGWNCAEILCVRWRFRTWEPGQKTPQFRFFQSEQSHHRFVSCIHLCDAGQFCPLGGGFAQDQAF